MDIVIAFLIAAALAYLAIKHHKQSKKYGPDDIDYDDDVPPSPRDNNDPPRAQT